VFENKGSILAMGGQEGNNAYPTQAGTASSGGKGGDGRIRVDVPKDTPLGNIVPAPYLGSTSNEM
jgi:hypothetical protein